MDPDKIGLEPGDIYVALVDLNDDGIKEIIAFAAHGSRFATAVWGTDTVIYRQSQGKLIPLFDGGTEGELAVLKNITNGYHDILSFVGEYPVNSGKCHKYTLALDKQTNQYNYVRTEEISSKGWE